MTAALDGDVLTGIDLVECDRRVMAPRDVDTVQRVLDHIGPDGGFMRVLYLDRSRFPRHRRPAVPDLESGYRDARPPDGHHVATAVAVNYRPAGARQRHRLIDDDP